MSLSSQVAALATRVATEIKALKVLPKSLTGTYAQRPTASSVPDGTIYYATNVPEAYRSQGSTWYNVGAGGNELGYAQTIAMFSTTSSSPVDVTGLTTTFVVGERPIELVFHADLANSVAANPVVAYVMLDGVIKVRPSTRGIYNDTWHTVNGSVRIAGLTPGTTHVAKIAVATGGGTGRITGDFDNPAFITARTL